MGPLDASLRLLVIELLLVLVIELVGDVVVQHGILLQPLAPLSVLHLSVLPLLIAATLGPCLQWTCGQFVWFWP
jgi:hypothetical protein